MATHSQIYPTHKGPSLRTSREADGGAHLRPETHEQLGRYSRAGAHGRTLTHSGHVASSTGSLWCSQTLRDLRCPEAPCRPLLGLLFAETPNDPWPLCLWPALNMCFFSCELEVATPEPPSQNWGGVGLPSFLVLVHFLVTCAPRLQGLPLPSMLLGVSASGKSRPLNSMSSQSSYRLIHHRANCPGLVSLQIGQD